MFSTFSGTFSGLFFFFLIMEEIILACVTNSPKLYFYPIPTWMENGKMHRSEKGAGAGRWWLGHQAGDGESRSGQNLGFQTSGANKLLKAWW